MRSGQVLFALRLTVLGCGVLACGREAQRPAAGQARAQPRAVETAAVERAGDGGRVSVPASVQARQRARLAARVSASVVELPWREGDHVQRGALVARLDDTALRSGLRAAETAARTADADVARVAALLQAGAGTERDVDESRARAALATAALSTATETLSYAVLRAPFDGTVAARPANVGDVVAAGTTLIEIEGTGGLELQATLESGLAAQLRPGATLEATVDGQTAALAVVVRALSTAGDPSTHRFELKADLPAAPGLRSGLFARLHLPAQAGPVRLLVPQDAVFERGGLVGVVVAEGGQAHLRWIAVGATAAGRTEVRAGVAAGERVVRNPRGLGDGDPLVEASPSPR